MTSIVGDAADQIGQRLRGAQRDVGVALVGALVAEVEYAGDGQHARWRRTRPDTLILSPTADAEIVGELGADEDVVGWSVAAAPATM